MARLFEWTVRMLAAGALIIGMLLCASEVDVWAQQFDLNAYKALVDADSPQTVPDGTVITIGNWQKYRNFFGIGEQALYGGRY